MPEEEKPGEGEEKALPGLTALLSPEAVVFLPLAIILDLAGLILAIFGISEIFSFIVDFIGLITIGVWCYFHSQTVQVTKGAALRVGKLAKISRILRWLRPLMIFLEFVPFVGALPCWTILVLFELQT